MAQQLNNKKQSTEALIAELEKKFNHPIEILVSIIKFADKIKNLKAQGYTEDEIELEFEDTSFAEKIGVADDQVYYFEYFKELGPNFSAEDLDDQSDFLIEEALDAAYNLLLHFLNY